MFEPRGQKASDNTCFRSRAARGVNVNPPFVLQNRPAFRGASLDTATQYVPGAAGSITIACSADRNSAGNGRRVQVSALSLETNNCADAVPAISVPGRCGSI